jgi:nicotinamidase-related amidase
MRGLKTDAEVIAGIRSAVASAAPMALSDLDPERAVLLIVDMVNGFAREGALASPRVEALIPEIKRIMVECGSRGIEIVAFGDSHPGCSPEFASYPAHCHQGTSEAEMVDELLSVGGFELIRKNSTNGFLEPAWQAWMVRHPRVDNFIVVGDCTDICIVQLATTLKAHFNRLNRPSQVIVPVNAVDTFDLPPHGADLMHLFALFMMMQGGVTVARNLI